MGAEATLPSQNKEADTDPLKIFREKLVVIVADVRANLGINAATPIVSYTPYFFPFDGEESIDTNNGRALQDSQYLQGRVRDAVVELLKMNGLDVTFEYLEDAYNSYNMFDNPATKLLVAREIAHNMEKFTKLMTLLEDVRAHIIDTNPIENVGDLFSNLINNTTQVFLIRMNTVHSGIVKYRYEGLFNALNIFAAQFSNVPGVNSTTLVPGTNIQYQSHPSYRLKILNAIIQNAIIQNANTQLELPDLSQLDNDADILQLLLETSSVRQYITENQTELEIVAYSVMGVHDLIRNIFATFCQ
jgi:hypothetical protein